MSCCVAYSRGRFRTHDSSRGGAWGVLSGPAHHVDTQVVVTAPPAAWIAYPARRPSQRALALLQLSRLGPKVYPNLIGSGPPKQSERGTLLERIIRFRFTACLPWKKSSLASRELELLSGVRVAVRSL